MMMNAVIKEVGLVLFIISDIRETMILLLHKECSPHIKINSFSSKCRLVEVPMVQFLGIRGNGQQS